MVRDLQLLNNPVVEKKVQDGKLELIFDKKQHAQTLLHNLIVMQDNEEGSLTDVVITSNENEQFHFHAPILASLSKNLEETLLRQGLGSAASKNSKIVMEENFSSAAVQCLWDYAYTSVVTLTPSNINEVKEMAEHHCIDSLLQKCTELLDGERFGEGHDREEVGFENLPELILNRLHNFLEQNVLCTAVIIDSLSLTRFPCHVAVIAAACNEFFLELAFGDGNNIIDLPWHETSKSLGPFLKYLYTAKLVIDQTTMQPLTDFAVKFNIPSLENARCNYQTFAFSADNALEIKSIAQDLRNKDKNPVVLVTDSEGVTFFALADELYQYSREFVARNFLRVTESDAFLVISFEELIDLIVDDDLGVHSEEEVVYAIMKWVCCSPGTRANNLPNLLEAVRLEYIPVDFLEALLEHELMMTDSQCIQIIEDAQTIRMPSRPRRHSIVRQYDV